MSTRNKKEQKWQQVQERAFTSWINQTLQKKDKSITVTDLRADLDDGVKLIRFFEQLSKRTLKDRYYPQPKSRIQKIQNCHLALQFLERETGVSGYHSGCSAEDIVDCAKDLKLVLGLLWTLYRKFRMVVTNIPDSSSFEDFDPTDTTHPAYNPLFDPNSPSYDPNAWFTASLACSDPNSPTYDPNNIAYDPTLDSSNPAYIPYLDPNNPAYNPLLDPNSPKYWPAIDPNHPAYNPKMDPNSPQYNPAFDPNNPAYDPNNPEVAKAVAAAEAAAAAARANRGRIRRGRRAKAATSSKTKGPEEQILDWIRSLTANYPGVNITNYRTSFSDGLAFAALVKEYDPSSVSYTWDEIKQMPAEKVLEFAMDHAEKHMGITRLLEVDEIVEGSVDDRALALYSSLYYTAFQNKTQMNAIEKKLTTDLELEKKSAGELVKMTQDISAELSAAKVTHAEEKEHAERLHHELVELRAKFNELTALLAGRDKELTTGRLDFTNMERDRNELLSNYHQLQERNRQLNEQMEAIQQLCESETDKAKKAAQQLDATKAEVQKTKEEIARTTEELEREKVSIEGGQRKLIEQMEQQSNKTQKLTEEKCALESHMIELTTQIEDLRTMATSETKDKKKTNSQLSKHQEQLKLNSMGLDVLRRNLDQHLGDLGRWHKYLEGNSADVEEAADTTKEMAELEQLSFTEQLNALSGKLESENVVMTKILQGQLAKQQQQHHRTKS